MSRPAGPRTGANIAYLLALSWRLDPARVALQFLEQAVVYGVWVFFSVFFLRFLLQALEAQAPVEGIFLGVGVSLAVVAAFAALLSWYNARYRPLSDLRMASALSRALFAQAVRVDLANYEDEEFYNRFSLAQIDAWLLVFLLFPLVGNFVFGHWLNQVRYRRDQEASAPFSKRSRASPGLTTPRRGPCSLWNSGTSASATEGKERLFTRFRAP